MIDGDDTYDAAAAPLMIETLLDGPYDHVARRPQAGGRRRRLPRRPRDRQQGAQRRGRHVFGESVGDMLSGYRVFSRRFVKSFPAVSREFEIETELTVHSLDLRVPRTSVRGRLPRPARGQRVSKLRTYHDGFRILGLIFGLARHERPGRVLRDVRHPELDRRVGTDGADRVRVLGDGPGAPVPDPVPRIHPACCVGCLCWTAGLILDGIRRSRHESARLMYLRYPAVGRPDEHRPR